MIRFRPFAARRTSLVATALVFGCWAAGCDEVGKRYPVTGRVLRNGAPILGKEGFVVFKPDRRKGNKSPFEAVGTIEADGTYELVTGAKAGAPPGWYKVIVTIGEPDKSGIQNKTAPTKNTKSTLVIPARYADEAKSGLSKEVVAQSAAGANDLDLK